MHFKESKPIKTISFLHFTSTTHALDTQGIPPKTEGQQNFCLCRSDSVFLSNFRAGWTAMKHLRL